MTAKMEVLIREFICKHDLENNLAFNSYFSLIVDNMRLKIKQVVSLLSVQ